MDERESERARGRTESPWQRHLFIPLAALQEGSGAVTKKKVKKKWPDWESGHGQSALCALWVIVYLSQFSPSSHRQHGSLLDPNRAPWGFDFRMVWTSARRVSGPIA